MKEKTKTKRNQAVKFDPQTLADSEQIKSKFFDFCHTISCLRDPQKGCPWDLEQDYMSLRKFVLEEAYEVVEAIRNGDTTDIAEELGDLLLQVVLLAQVGHDRGEFSIIEVIDSINQKMIRRHPHVFSDDFKRQEGEKSSISSKQVLSNWEDIKKEEKAKKRERAEKSIEGSPQQSYFDRNEIGKVFPSWKRSMKIGKLAKKINFDWDDLKEVTANLESEISELRQAIEQYEAAHSQRGLENVKEEVSDAFFSLIQVCRFLKYDPDIAMMDGNAKFLKRFAGLERLAMSDGLDIENMPREQLEQYWIKAKVLQKKP